MLTNKIPAAEETDIAAEVAHRAMAIGWFNAIQQVSKEKSIDPLVIRNMLNKVQEFQAKEDPHGRIDELSSWQQYKNGTEIASRTRGNIPPVHSKEVLMARLALAHKALAKKRAKAKA